MSTPEFRLPRVEGGLQLIQAGNGSIRLAGAPPHFFEPRMAGRSPLDAVILTQQISADAAVGHAMAGVSAWENAAAVPLTENGRILRDLLRALSLMHAHVRHFYQQALPDYLPPGTLVDYNGSFPRLRRLKDGLKDRSSKDWTRYVFGHPFSVREQAQLWENTHTALGVLRTLQKMMAMMGGKYPVVMSLTPGGISLPLREDTVLKWRAYLNGVRDFLVSVQEEDARLVLKRYPGMWRQGRGREDFLCVGTGEDEASLETSLFPSGLFLEGRLERFTGRVVESIAHAYYRVPTTQPPRGVLVEPAPDKPGAYSWIKAPRYDGRALETGPFARLVISYLSGVRLHDPKLVREIGRAAGVPLTRANTAGGRMLARAGEVAALVVRCDVLLDQLDPAHPTVQPEGNPFRASGEGTGYVEAPAGALQHRIVLEKGKVVFYDIISPSTWNGSPEAPEGGRGALEAALNRKSLPLGRPDGLRAASRIVQSFAFSMSDAVH